MGGASVLTFGAPIYIFPPDTYAERFVRRKNNTARHTKSTTECRSIHQIVARKRFETLLSLGHVQV